MTRAEPLVCPADQDTLRWMLGVWSQLSGAGWVMCAADLGLWVPFGVFGHAEVVWGVEVGRTNHPGVELVLRQRCRSSQELVYLLEQVMKAFGSGQNLVVVSGGSGKQHPDADLLVGGWSVPVLRLPELSEHQLPMVGVRMPWPR